MVSLKSSLYDSSPVVIWMKHLAIQLAMALLGCLSTRSHLFVLKNICFYFKINHIDLMNRKLVYNNKQQKKHLLTVC